MYFNKSIKGSSVDTGFYDAIDFLIILFFQIGFRNENEIQ